MRWTTAESGTSALRMAMLRWRIDSRVDLHGVYGREEDEKRRDRLTLIYLTCVPIDYRYRRQCLWGLCSSAVGMSEPRQNRKRTVVKPWIYPKVVMETPRSEQ